MDYYEVTELAAEILGIDTWAEDFEEDKVEQLLWDAYEVSLESFRGIADKLLNMTPVVPTMFSGENVQGFLKDGMFIVKKYVKE